MVGGHGTENESTSTFGLECINPFPTLSGTHIQQTFGWDSDISGPLDSFDHFNDHQSNFDPSLQDLAFGPESFISPPIRSGFESVVRQTQNINPYFRRAC